MVQGYDEEKDASDHAGWLAMGKIARETQEALEKKAEVKLTRIDTNTFFRISSSLDRFKTQVDGAHGSWYSDLPVDDFRSLLDIYQEIPHQGLNLEPVRFVFNIDYRVYAEWCMGVGEGLNHWEKHNNYQGEGFTSFMDKEVHYELEKQRSEGDRGTHEGYLRARQRVLGGLVLRAVELFSEWDGTSPPCRKEELGLAIKCTWDDKRNLRDDLKDYIARYDSLRQQQPQAA